MASSSASSSSSEPSNSGRGHHRSQSKRFQREITMSKRSTSQNVPKEMQARFDEITQLTDAFSDAYLNDEYADLCRQLTATLCRKRPSPLMRGKAATWACG